MGPNRTGQRKGGTLANPRSTWDPFRDLDAFSRRLFGGTPIQSAEERAAAGSRWMPPVDIAETDSEYAIAIELPGLEREQVSVVVEDGVLAVSGERTFESEHRERKVHRVERAYGSFQRSFRIPEDADASTVSAAFRNGVLAITLPKTPESKPRRIDVEVG